MQLGRYGVFSERAPRELSVEDGRLEVLIAPDRPAGAISWMAINPGGAGEAPR